MVRFNNTATIKQASKQTKKATRKAASEAARQQANQEASPPANKPTQIRQSTIESASLQASLPASQSPSKPTASKQQAASNSSRQAATAEAAAEPDSQNGATPCKNKRSGQPANMFCVISALEHKSNLSIPKRQFIQYCFECVIFLILVAVKRGCAILRHVIVMSNSIGNQ